MPDDAAERGVPDEIDVAPPPFTVWGIDRGREFGGAAWIELGDGSVAVLIATTPRTAGAGVAARFFYPIAAVDGARVELMPAAADRDARAQLTVFLGGGDVLEVTGTPAAVRALARRLEDDACALTEQTLPLRGLGSHRAHPGSDHDRFYGPLLAARRAAERADSAADRVAAFDAAAIGRALDGALAGFAADRFPEEGPGRRALSAELRELAEPVQVALARLASAAAATRAAPDDARFLRWREWALVVREVFAAADAAWLESVPTLCDSRGRAGRFWRRLLFRRPGGARPA
ncbi:MAG TPA: hypothetical protein VNS52_15370 [Gemmatimonadaceae bacterium]|nr:hypothetical protein [Gemmatimonadaceae bacterium]